MPSWITPLLLIAALLAGFSAAVYEHHSGYVEGSAAATATYKEAIARQKLAYDAKLLDAQDKLAVTQSRDAVALDAALHSARADTVTVTRIIHEHPHFASTTLPPALVILQNSQLEAINTAATGAAPAVSGSAAAVPGVGRHPDQ